MKKVRIILIVILVLILAGGAAVYYVFNKPHRDVEGEKALQVAANDLFKNYTQNEKQSNSNYLDKALEVEGRIEEVRTNQDNKTVVVFKTDDPIYGVVCTFKTSLANLGNGSDITVKGLCSGYDGNDVKLRDCVLVHPK
ncbi:MAG: hypothetical protein C5B52_17260 [Bacteroidetes bacterium]|nr:MAG: hypothetical protein C5B52_17260 [Bacteroidota bacterium]